jgi:tetratricopeptide (TPR) repeat protein
MRNKYLRSLLLVILAGISSFTGFSQKGVEDGSKYGHGQDSVNCTRNLSLFYEYYKHENYKDAIIPWRKVYNECPKSRDYLFTYGTNMYKSFIEATTDKQLISAYVDTVMMIHESRIKYWGEEGKVLGFAGIDLLRYRRSDGVEYVRKGYDMLRKSMELEKEKSSAAVVITFVTASISLYLEQHLTNEQVIADYVMASDILDAQLKKAPSPRVQQAKDIIDGNIKESKALTCEAINRIYGPKFEENKDNINFLKHVAVLLNDANCENEQFYTTVAEKLYQSEPSAPAAYNLARLFFRRENYEKAKSYYLEALDKATDNDSKANYYYELGIIYNSFSKQPREAADCAEEAIKLKSGWGEPYLLLGQAFVNGKNQFEDDFQQQTVFWAAVDMFQKAKAVDPSVTDKANTLIREYTNYYPSKEEVFFRTLADGQSYTVGGWINKTTSVRSK